MTKNQNVNLAGLQNDEHFQFNGEFGEVVNDFGADNLKVEPQFEKWTEAFHEEDVALKKISKSARTSEIHAADKQRSDIFRGLANSCKTATCHYDDNVKRAARELQIVFDAYGNLACVGLSKKTSAIFNLLQELSVNHAEDVVATGLEGWVQQLEKANSECNRLMRDRWEEISARTKIVVREARAKVDAIYCDIVARIRARKLLEEDEIYGQFLDRLGAVVDFYNRIVARRHRKPGDNGHETDLPANNSL